MTGKLRPYGACIYDKDQHNFCVCCSGNWYTWLDMYKEVYSFDYDSKHWIIITVTAIGCDEIEQIITIRCILLECF